MLRIVTLAVLSAPLFFSMPAMASPTYSTLAQARADHPGSYIGFRILDSGDRCWYIGRKPSKRSCEVSMRHQIWPRERAMAVLCGGKCTRNYGAIEWRPRPPVPHVTLVARYWQP
jgi:hypothetical protein